MFERIDETLEFLVGSPLLGRVREDLDGAPRLGHVRSPRQLSRSLRPDPALGIPVSTLLFASDYALTLVQARLFVSAEFAPTILLRVAFYGVWHVAWGVSAGA